MVETEIKNKVDRAIEQAFNSLNSECSSGNFVKQRIDSYLGSYAVRMDMDKAVRDELKNKVIQVVLKDCEMNK
jgi:hypothetical protein